MNPFLVFVGVTTLVFAYRFAGFTLNIRRVSPLWERFLHFVPVSVFTALVVSSLYKNGESLDVTLIALVVAGAVMWRTRQLGLSILLGLGALWILALLGPR